MAGFRSQLDPALLVGLDPFDDAAVYEVAPGVALVSTTDFFPPLVDDPADFGAIAAANACSDVFAMGGRVVLALNIAAFPEVLGTEVMEVVLNAAADTVAAAGGTVAGGHTIRSDEPIFGLAVQGVVDPKRILRKGGARPGDILLLSKPIGTGIVLAGGSPEDRAATIVGMRRLNQEASLALGEVGPSAHGATDVTGFGLAGHAWELAERSGVEVRLAVGAVQLYPGALTAATAGTVTGGDARNREYLGGDVHIDPAMPVAMQALAFDPQTSGGLLAAVDPAAVDDLIGAGFVAVGEVAAGRARVVLAV